MRKRTKGKRDGYYVDVSSADGVVHSNTYVFDQMGWKGVCIDPFPTNMQTRTCQMLRQPVFNKSGKKVSFRAAGENSGIADTMNRYKENTSNAPMVAFVTATLDEILEKAKAPRHIDYVSIDVEGAELDVLRGSRWISTKWTPSLSNTTTSHRSARTILAGAVPRKAGDTFF